MLSLAIGNDFFGVSCQQLDDDAQKLHYGSRLSALKQLLSSL